VKDQENAAKALATALTRLETFIDPFDGACGIDGIARHEIRQGQYFQSWVLPHVRFALAVLSDTVTDEMREDLAWTARDRTHQNKQETMYRSPFSRFRGIPTPKCPRGGPCMDDHEFWPSRERCRNCGYRPGSFAEMARSAPLVSVRS